MNILLKHHANYSIKNRQGNEPIELSPHIASIGEGEKSSGTSIPNACMVIITLL
ncbi:MAG UNVERIFIED_CONTAM: hypothetical protein LVQ98_06190 [Rickettsiaceae bacterium]